MCVCVLYRGVAPNIIHQWLLSSFVFVHNTQGHLFSDGGRRPRNWISGVLESCLTPY
jgi:hypothetical protein